MARRVLGISWLWSGRAEGELWLGWDRVGMIEFWGFGDLRRGLGLGLGIFYYLEFFGFVWG